MVARKIIPLKPFNVITILYYFDRLANEKLERVRIYGYMDYSLGSKYFNFGINTFMCTCFTLDFFVLFLLFLIFL